MTNLIVIISTDVTIYTVTLSKEPVLVATGIITKLLYMNKISETEVECSKRKNQNSY